MGALGNERGGVRRCAVEEPVLQPESGRLVACHLYDEPAR
jgi:hypothetical protein